MKDWIKYSLRVWAAYWTGWLIVNLMLLTAVVFAMCAYTLWHLLLQ